MKIRYSSSWIILCAFALPLLAAPAQENPWTLLETAFKPCSLPYSGELTITHWHGDNTRSEDVKVWFKPPSSYRWEYLKPDGSVDRVLIRNGGNEHLNINQMSLKGAANKTLPKQMSDEVEWALLQKNYDAALAGQEMLLGKKVFVVELTPKQEGKPHRKYLIAADTKIILEAKQFLPNHHVATQSRFTRFNASPSFGADLFSPGSENQADQGYDQEFFDLAEYGKRTGKKLPLPPTLPLGFQFESLDFFDSDSNKVQHFRYTDGLISLSIFETAKPSRFSKQSMDPSQPLPSAGVLPLQLTDSGRILHKKSNDRYFTFIGDLSEEGLETIAHSLK